MTESASDDGAIRRVKNNVLERIAVASTSQHLTVPAGAQGWQPFLTGVRLKVLYEQDGVMSYLLEMAPGAVLPGHRHLQDEECVVLEGEVRIGQTLVVRKGDYHRGRAGVLHAPIMSDGGALLFLRGAAPEATHFI